jgi:hypothetical protein
MLSIGVSKAQAETLGRSSRRDRASTGEKVELPSDGSVTRTTINTDGTATVENTGHNVLILFPTDVPAGPLTTLYVGRLVYTADSGHARARCCVECHRCVLARTERCRTRPDRRDPPDKIAAPAGDHTSAGRQRARGNRTDPRRRCDLDGPGLARSPRPGPGHRRRLVVTGRARRVTSRADVHTGEATSAKERERIFAPMVELALATSAHV